MWCLKHVSKWDRSTPMNNFVLESEVPWLNYFHALSNQKLIRRQIPSSAQAVRNHGAVLLAREEGEESSTSCSICAKFKWITFVILETHFHGTLDYYLNTPHKVPSMKNVTLLKLAYIIIPCSGGNWVIRSHSSAIVPLLGSGIEGWWPNCKAWYRCANSSIKARRCISLSLSQSLHCWSEYPLTFHQDTHRGTCKQLR